MFKSILLLAILTAVQVKAQVISKGSIPDRIYDDVTFKAIDFPCELRIMGKPFGQLTPGQAKNIKLERGNEYLVECENTSFPVKLYARLNFFGMARIRNGSLPSDVELHPVAVLPNIVKAVAAGGVIAKTVANAAPVQCEKKLDESSSAGWNSDPGKILAVSGVPAIPKGTKVTLTAKRPLFCENTNLVEVQLGPSQIWFRNKDFEFYYGDKAILLYPPSRDLYCCWIE